MPQTVHVVIEEVEVGSNAAGETYCIVGAYTEEADATKVVDDWREKHHVDADSSWCECHGIGWTMETVQLDLPPFDTETPCIQCGAAGGCDPNCNIGGHSKDEDCDVDPETQLCRECEVDHSNACPECGGRGFHRDGCKDA